MTTITQREATSEIDLLDGNGRIVKYDPATPLLNTFVDALSTDTPLGADEVFTTPWVDVGRYDSIVVATATDAPASYTLQFSTDAENVDSTLTRYVQTDQINPPHRFTITRRYARIVYTNQSTAQTFLRIQCHVGSFAPLNAPLDGTLAQDFDAVAVRPDNYDDEVVLGRRQGHESFLKFGYNDDVDSAAVEVLGSFGGGFTPLATASALTIVSSDAADDGSPAGTGARSVFITGIDENRRFQQEVVTMNGTTNVVTSTTWLGINRVVVLSAGSSQGNVGNITVTGGGATQAYIPAGEGITQQCIFFNEDGFTGLVRRITINALKFANGTSPRLTITLKVWNPKVTNAIYNVRRIKMDTEVTNDVRRDFDPPLKLDPTDVAWLEVETDQDNTVVDGEIDIIKVRAPATQAVVAP